MELAWITESEVKKVLADLLAARDPNESPLQALQLVEDRVTATGRASGPSQRAWALGDALFEIARENLVEARRSAAARRPVDASSASQGAPVQQDFAAGSMHLEAWSCLYHHYLTASPMRVQEIAAVVRPGSPHGRRLISRRMARGYTLLTHALRGRERKALAGRSVRLTAAGQSLALADERRVMRLPVPVSSFVGRGRELAELRAALRRTRVLTLTGLGGAGKSRLALRLAETSAGDFPDGVDFVDLTIIDDAQLVVPVIAGALGVRAERGRALADTLVAALAPRRALLVLDGCEHVLGEVANAASALLSAAPGLVVLATSREAILVPGETIWPVPPLAGAVPPVKGRSDAPSLAKNEAATLFIERARSARPGWTLGPDAMVAVESICAHLDGLPLAIELAAARARHLTPSEILAQIDDRFRLTAGGVRGAPARHQTLRAVLDSSYEILGAPERVLFRRLGAFRGGWTLEAAEGVCSGRGLDRGSVLNVLGRLMDQSLVHISESAEGTRYAFLETVAAYAREQLEHAGETARVIARHRAWYLQLLVQAAPHLCGPEQAAWLDRLAREHDNLRAAAQTALSRATAEDAMQFTALLWPTWRRESVQEIERLLVQSLGLPGADRSSDARVQALLAAGFATGFAVSPSAGCVHLREAVDLARRRGDVRLEAAAHYGLGALLSGDVDRAAGEAHLRTALVLAQRMGEERLMGQVHSELGWLATGSGDHAAARTHLEFALGLLQRTGDIMEEALVLNRLGLLAHHCADLAEAERWFGASRDLRAHLGDRPGLSQVLSNLGLVAEDRADFARAAEHYAASRSIARELGHSTHYAIATANLGLARLLLGDVAAAKDLLADVLCGTWHAMSPLNQLYALESVVRIALAAGDDVRAARLLGTTMAQRAARHLPLPDGAPAEWLGVARADLEATLGTVGYEQAVVEGETLDLAEAAALATAMVGAPMRPDVADDIDGIAHG